MHAAGVFQVCSQVGGGREGEKERRGEGGAERPESCERVRGEAPEASSLTAPSCLSVPVCPVLSCPAWKCPSLSRLPCHRHMQGMAHSIFKHHHIGLLQTSCELFTRATACHIHVHPCLSRLFCFKNAGGSGSPNGGEG